MVATAVIAARVYLRLKIQNRRMLVSDIIMCAAWVFAIITAAFGPVFASKGALDPDVHTSLEGYKGGVEDLQLVLQVRASGKGQQESRLTSPVVLCRQFSLLHHVLPLQGRPSRRLLAGVSRVHGQEKDIFMGDDRLCGHRLRCYYHLDIHHMSASGTELVSWPFGAKPMACLMAFNREISVEKSCPGSSYAILFQVGWGLHFLGDLLGECSSPE